MALHSIGLTLNLLNSNHSIFERGGGRGRIKIISCCLTTSINISYCPSASLSSLLLPVSIPSLPERQRDYELQRHHKATDSAVCSEWQACPHLFESSVQWSWQGIRSSYCSRQHVRQTFVMLALLSFTFVHVGPLTNGQLRS